jgi:adenylate cyclase
MHPFRHPLRLLLPVLLLAAAAAVQLAWPGWAGRAEALLVDARFLLRGPEQPQNKIVIVALDEASFQTLGELGGENIRTWPRSRWAELVETLNAYHPLLVVLDVVFDTPAWDEGGDDRLATALINAGNVVLASRVEAQYSEAAGLGAALYTYSPPTPLLESASAGVGLATFIADPDGSVRSLHPLQPWTIEESLPALSLVAAASARSEPIDVPYADLNSPTAADASLPIHFRGPEGTFRTLSLVDVLDPQSSLLTPAELSETLAGAIVLVGYTTRQEQDRHPAPFGGAQFMPGVEIQANAVDTLLAGDWLKRTPAWLGLVLVLAAVLLGWGAANLPNPSLGIALFLVVLLAYLGAGQLAFNLADTLLPLAGPLLAGLVGGGVSISERMVFAERDKRLLRRRFAGMMSPERLSALLDNWEALLNPDRPEKRAAVMFVDIRGFTHATETLQRQGRSAEMVRFLTEYLDRMAQAVFLEGGVVYRTFGDGLLILFGVPEPLPNHALRAVRAALRMAEAAEALQRAWPLRAEGPFQMGVGLNEGPLTDAIVGGQRRFDYTVLGDPVNTAARIESHCKVAMDLPRPPGEHAVPAHTTILLQRDLYEQVRGEVIVDEEIPPFAARGKREPVQVVRLLGPAAPLA